MKQTMFSLVLVLGVCIVSTASAQPDENYSVDLLDASGSIGGTADVTLELTNTGEDLQGWQWGVCNDTLVSIDAADVANGDAVAATAFTFHAVSGFTEGWTVGCLTNVLTGAVLAPGDNLEMYICSYGLNEIGTSELDFCETLGTTQLVTVRVIVNNTEIEPVQDGATIEITEGPPPYKYTAEDVNVPYDPEAPGEIAFSVDLFIEENPDNDGFPNDTQGFSMGIAHDGALVDAVDFDPIGRLATVFNGGPPNFFGVSLNPNMGMDDGVTVGVVYNLMGGTFMAFEGMTEACQADYIVLDEEANLGGNEKGISTMVTWVDDLGEPDVANTVVVGGSSLAIEFVDGKVDLAPLVAVPFVRGDCNDDVILDIADGIFILNHLFDPPEKRSPAPTCEAACDLNGDDGLDQADAIFIFNYQVLDGPPPEGPFPACGAVDPKIEPCDAQESCL